MKSGELAYVTLVTVKVEPTSRGEGSSSWPEENAVGELRKPTVGWAVTLHGEAT